MNWLRSLWPGRATALDHHPVIEADGGYLVPAPDMPTVTAVELWKAWHDNVVDAEARWGGRPLRITGVVERVDRRDKNTVALVLHAGLWCRVTCRYPDARRDELAGVRPGDEVAVVGVMRVMMTIEAWVDAA